ncbi:MAG: ClbS/DfsB family four-helix bundle protein [Nannocystales bacterium]
MAIPKTREELDSAMETAFGKLSLDLDRLSASQSREVCIDDWTVVDVLTVRTWWGHAVVEWIEAGQRGEIPQTPAPGFAWKDTPRLNAGIIADAPKRRSWKRVRADFAASREAVLAALEQLSDTELEGEGEFEWAGRWPVLRWVSVATTTGYASSRKYVRALLRRLEG